MVLRFLFLKKNFEVILFCDGSCLIRSARRHCDRTVSDRHLYSRVFLVFSCKVGFIGIKGINTICGQECLI